MRQACAKLLQDLEQAVTLTHVTYRSYCPTCDWADTGPYQSRHADKHTRDTGHTTHTLGLPEVKP